MRLLDLPNDIRKKVIEKFVKNISLTDIQEWLKQEGYDYHYNSIINYKKEIMYAIEKNKELTESIEKFTVKKWQNVMNQLSKIMEELNESKERAKKKGNEREFIKAVNAQLRGLSLIGKKLGMFKNIFQKHEYNVQGNINIVKELKQQMLSIGKLHKDKVIIDKPEIVEWFKKKKKKIEVET
ncbi:hypothetical protein GF386_00915 [Candidatus Pacearchaeota archaeon]|nr:hypothetical protein [Candidatus Pacearchaeota archaeon]